MEINKEALQQLSIADLLAIENHVLSNLGSISYDSKEREEMLFEIKKETLNRIKNIFIL